MPELPEVETVRRGLAPVMEKAVFAAVEMRRPDLRFPLPLDFAKRLIGARVQGLDRRGKYLLAGLSTGETLIMHLGMSGRFTLAPNGRRNEPAGPHDHVVFEMRNRNRLRRIVYSDARRFGFMDFAPTGSLGESRHLRAIGEEPLSEAFTARALRAALRGRAAPIKAALIDQRLVAGLGNIYASEALFRAKISPRRRASSIGAARSVRLWTAIREVLNEAILSGGSSFRDFAGAGGEAGCFQHRFQVYDREGEPCVICGRLVRRLVQSGRSTFYCGNCQR